MAKYLAPKQQPPPTLQRSSTTTSSTKSTSISRARAAVAAASATGVPIPASATVPHSQGASGPPLSASAPSSCLPSSSKAAGVPDASHSTPATKLQGSGPQAVPTTTTVTSSSEAGEGMISPAGKLSLLPPSSMSESSAMAALAIPSSSKPNASSLGDDTQDAAASPHPPDFIKRYNPFAV